jgi:putative ABC transport system permease protein
MWRVSLRDLQWRRRRFGIALAACALVFALTLLMSGLAASWGNQVRRTVRAIGADAWVIPEKVAGPFTSGATFGESAVDDVAKSPGVRQAGPLLVARAVVLGSPVTDINLIGFRPGGIGAPPLADGRPVRAAGEVVVDRSLGMEVGERLTLRDNVLRVVGRTDGLTFFAGDPTVWMHVGDAQRIAFDGLPLLTAVVTRGVPGEVPIGFSTRTDAQVQDDLTRPLDRAVGTTVFISVLLWLVAAGIIGAVIYLSAMERTREFAVLKATGASNGHLLVGLSLQTGALAAGAAAVACVLAALIAPTFPLQVEIPGLAYLMLPVVAVGAGLVASLAALRRAVRIDPALAFKVA